VCQPLQRLCIGRRLRLLVGRHVCVHGAAHKQAGPQVKDGGLQARSRDKGQQ
jgi:hypothetical protein